MKKIANPNRQPTILEVSRKAGVSTATVSRVLAGLEGAGDATRKKVLRVVKELGYQPNRLARNLRATSRKVVGVVIPDLQNPFFTGIVGGIEEVLHDAGYTLFLANSDDNIDRELIEMQTMRSDRVSGILLIPCQSEAPHYQEMAWSDTPIVAIDRSPIGLDVDFVATNNEEGAYLGTSRLIEAGHKKIGIINGPEKNDVVKERQAGFRRALKMGRIKVRESWTARGDFRIGGGKKAAMQIMSGAERPKALFVTNFLMMLGALQAVHELGLKIPDDVAIISFDDMPWNIAMNPPISAVAQPTRELGKTAAQLLLDRLAEPARSVRRVALQPELKVRASCKAMEK